MVVFTGVKRSDLKQLKDFRADNVKTIHEEVRLVRTGVTAILYNSGKLLLQGKDVKRVAEEIRTLGFGEEVKGETFRKQTGWMIGSDESLKGDTFGGLIVAAVKADDRIRAELLEIGVADSKKLHDREILRMAEKIKKIAPCEIKSLMPEEYNHRKGNVTQLLNKLHAESARYLHPGKHIVDEYPGCSVGDIITTKAESKYIEVAAASVLARSAALHQMDYLSLELGFKVPKGSTHVKEGLLELKKQGLPFKSFVKVDFKNVVDFLK
jgi:ribonuclease HIII